MDGHVKASFLRELWRFFKKTKQKSERTSCCVILDHNKKVERWKEGFPITDADYTQYRWRAVKGHGKSSKHQCAEGCSCRLVKEFTRAKERGDENIIQQIKDGTYVLPDNYGENGDQDRPRLRRAKSESEALNRRRHSQKMDDKIVKQSDGNKTVTQPQESVKTGNTEVNASSHLSCNTPVEPVSGMQSKSSPVSSLNDTGYSKEQVHVHRICSVPNDRGHATHADPPRQYEPGELRRVETWSSYHEENENTINDLKHARRENKRSKSLRRSFRRTVDKMRRNSMEAKMRRRNYASLSGDSEDESDDHVLSDSNVC